jgi:hypothetical protein
MNVNTYDATPLYEEVVSLPSRLLNRVLCDSGGDLWFEVQPGKFVYTLEQTREGAIRRFGKNSYCELVDFVGGYTFL